MWKWTLKIFARSLDSRRSRKTFLPLKDWSRRKGRVQWPGAAEEVLVPWRFCHNTQPAAAAATRAFSGKRREVGSSSSEVPPQRPRPAREVPGLPAASHGMSTLCQCCCRQSSSNVWMMFAIKHQRQHPQLPNFCSCFCGVYFNSVWIGHLMSFVSPLCWFTKFSFTTIPVCKCFASDWYQKVIPQFTTFCPLAFITVAINWGLIGTASSSVFN